jgi:uncharacterized protein YjcR
VPHIDDARTRAERLQRQGMRQKDIGTEVGVTPRQLRRWGVGVR